MSDLTAFRDHCARMSTAEHKPECSHLPPRHMYPVRYRAPQPDLFGELTDEPTEDR